LSRSERSEPYLQRFADAEQGYADWVSAHPGGYVLNVSSDDTDYQYPKLHRVSCAGATSSKESGDEYVKIVSTDQKELEDWANKKYGRVTYCGFCRP